MTNKFVFFEKLNGFGISIMSVLFKIFHIATLGFLFDWLFPKHKSWSLRKNTFIFCLGFLFLKYMIPWILKTTTGIEVGN
jgi:hypothetical protein